jgi:hypothetical protein
MLIFDRISELEGRQALISTTAGGGLGVLKRRYNHWLSFGSIRDFLGSLFPELGSYE